MNDTLRDDLKRLIDAHGYHAVSNQLHMLYQPDKHLSPRQQFLYTTDVSAEDMERTKAALLQRIKFAKPGPFFSCHLWTGHEVQRGKRVFGMYRPHINGRMTSDIVSYVAFYRAFVGPLEMTESVYHTCPRGEAIGCCNVAHLKKRPYRYGDQPAPPKHFRYLGTRLQNIFTGEVIEITESVKKTAEYLAITERYLYQLLANEIAIATNWILADATAFDYSSRSA